jgi:hypothetical protein
MKIFKNLNVNTYYKFLGSKKVYNKTFFFINILNLNFYDIDFKLSQKNLYS